MNFDEFSEFLQTAPKNGALLGIDNGEKNIGIAVSDLTRLIASPQSAVKRGKFGETAAAVFKIFDAKECIAVVVGYPINMDGTSGPSAQAARAFARNLAALRDVPILMADERLSTSAVQRQMIDADVSRKNRAIKVDSAAAAFVLQGVLDRLRG
ncbi:MAG: putative holliday junction resolvase [Hyphomonadaceae bacterium]|nr:MAG: putative holliday junction resolvase [Hyphomonadaceae bacterium]KAF0186174.1 MAG: putative holliday junction resolvase [Hyphomonadaceae bacterium]